MVLLGGGQGLGKTTFALQVMRNLVVTGHTAVYFSFDHDNTTLIERRIAMEAAEVAGLSGVSLKRVREAFETRQRNEPKLETRLAGTEAGVEAVQELREYGRRLYLHRSKSSDTDVEAMKRSSRRSVRTRGRHRSWSSTPCRRSISPGPGCSRRTTGPPWSSTVAVPADVVLILNDKFDVVARHHLVYNLASAERFRSWVIMTIEKNRNGVDKVDLEFEKQFAQGRFDPNGGRVEEELLDDRIFVE